MISAEHLAAVEARANEVMRRARLGNGEPAEIMRVCGHVFELLAEVKRAEALEAALRWAMDWVGCEALTPDADGWERDYNAARALLGGSPCPK